MNDPSMSDAQVSLQPPDARDAAEAATERRGGLMSQSFVGLLVTQFLGAMNDNIFRWLAVFIGKDLVLELHQGSLIAVAEGAIERDRQMAVAAGAGLLVLPFILLAAPAGYLGDRFSKRNVIIGCKAAEVVIMILGMAAILHGNIYVLFAVVFLMGSQSALFGPSKYGSIPEIVRDDRIQAANGLIGLTTIVAIVLGTVIPGYLYTWTRPLGRENWWISASVLVGVAGVGLLTSFLIRPLRAANPARRFPVNPLGRMVHDFGELARRRPLLLASLGSAAFWGVGMMCNLNVERTAALDMAITPEAVGWLVAMLALGIGAGSIAAGVWARGRIELGMVPYGAAGIALGAMLVFGLPQSHTVAVTAHFDQAQRIDRLAAEIRSDAVVVEVVPIEAASFPMPTTSVGMAPGMAPESTPALVYRIRLARPPRADVTVALRAEKPIEPAPATLAFTPEDWDRPRTVEVRKSTVPVRNGVQFARIDHLFASDDAAFDGLGRTFSRAYLLGCLFLFIAGFSAGLYDVPLNSFLQHRSPPEARGAILAANNALACTAMVAASGLFYLLSGPWELSGKTIFLLLGAAFVPVAVVSARLVARDALRLILRPMIHAMYRIRVEGLENLPREGGVLLTPNHVTWVDGFVLAMNCPRHVRFVVYAEYFTWWWTAWFGRVAGVIPIVPGTRSMVESVREARRALDEGEVICVFPEGTLTRTGRIGPFQPGFLKVLKGTGAPVVPVHLGGLWGSVFSFEGGRFFLKRPKRLGDPVTVRYGEPIPRATDVEQVRRAVLELARLDGEPQEDEPPGDEPGEDEPPGNSAVCEEVDHER
jgi:acyl-[acyl-carrier-protein]-phospholipid O-acyltransferase / long-chain-fatty-acid--[acyl-carrier-protein] ligase